MDFSTEAIIELSKVIGALGVIFACVFGFVKWLTRQEKQSIDIEELRNHHDEDLKSVQEELCVVNYAVLASLDALMQRGYGGNVAEAHVKLQKHINHKAHMQKGDK